MQTSSIPPLIVDGHICSDKTDKANILIIISLSDHYLMIRIHLFLQNFTCQTTMNIHDSFTVTPYAVEYIVSSLQLGKAVGPKIINNIILKDLKGVLSAPLCGRFNASRSQGKVPSIWKEVNVTLIHKNTIMRYS